MPFVWAGLFSEKGLEVGLFAQRGLIIYTGESLKVSWMVKECG